MVPQKVNTELPYDPAFPLQESTEYWKYTSTRKPLYTNDRSSIVPNSPEMESIQMSINWRMDEWRMEILWTGKSGRQKVEWWFPGAAGGENEDWLPLAGAFFLGMMEMF